MLICCLLLRKRKCSAGGWLKFGGVERARGGVVFLGGARKRSRVRGRVNVKYYRRVRIMSFPWEKGGFWGCGELGGQAFAGGFVLVMLIELRDF
jgi:hypothetical protein